MALTKKQKAETIDRGSERLKESQTLVFAEFKGVTVEHFKSLRRELRNAGADIQVLKKRLLNVVLKNAGVAFDPQTRKEQLGTIFAKGDISSIASIIYKFSKMLVKGKKGELTVLGAYNVIDKQLVDGNEFKAIATLPPREVLLAQIAMLLTMPIKKVLIALNERAKQTANG